MASGGRAWTHALADFDAATITTTHGFCQEVLGSLGRRRRRRARHDVVEDVTTSWPRWSTTSRAPLPPAARAASSPMPTRALAHAVIDNPDAASAATAPESAGRAAPALAGLREGRAAKRRRLLTYDDLLTRLRDALAAAPTAVRRLRERFRVALVDEFQDTDEVQWEILRRAFGAGRAPGADRRSEAGDLRLPRRRRVRLPRGRARRPTTRATLDVNWRTDQALLDAYDALLGGARLGHPDILPPRGAGGRRHADPA